MGGDLISHQCVHCFLFFPVWRGFVEQTFLSVLSVIINLEKEEKFTLDIWRRCASALYHQRSILNIVVIYQSLWLYITPRHSFNIVLCFREIFFFHCTRQSISSQFCVIWKSICRRLSRVICHSEHKILHRNSLFFLLHPVFYNQRSKWYQMSSLMVNYMDQL